MKTNFKTSQFSRFLQMSGYAVLVKIQKWLRLLISFPFIKKTLLNHLYIWIRSFWESFTASQWLKTNIKISEFEDFLRMFLYAILVKIWKWLKHFYSVPFIKKTPVNQFWIRIWTFWLTFTVLQWMKKNS